MFLSQYWLPCLLLLAAFQVAAGQQPAAGQSLPGVLRPAKSAPIKAASPAKRDASAVLTATSSTPPVTRLDDATLETMLTNMGLELETFPPATADGKKLFRTQLRGWFPVDVQLSNDGKYLFAFSNLRSVDDPAKVTGEILLKLLESSNTTAGNFVYWSGSQTFGAQRSLDNVNLSPVAVRRALEDLEKLCNDTFPTWDKIKNP